MLIFHTPPPRTETNHTKTRVIGQIMINYEIMIYFGFLVVPWSPFIHFWYFQNLREEFFMDYL